MIRRRRFSPWPLLLLFLLFFILSVPGLNGVVSTSNHFDFFVKGSDVVPSLTSPGRRSLMSLPNPPEQKTALIAAVDGTVHLVESKTMRIIWSFPSGAPLYSSYQADMDLLNASPTSFYIDSGDDWELYAHSLHSGGSVVMLSTQSHLLFFSKIKFLIF